MDGVFASNEGQTGTDSPEVKSLGEAIDAATAHVQLDKTPSLVPLFPFFLPLTAATINEKTPPLIFGVPSHKKGE